MKQLRFPGEDRVEVRGTIDRIVFRDKESGFTVARLREGGRSDKTVPLVGNFDSVGEGQFVEVSGKWVLNPRHGRQLNVEELRAVEPEGKEEITLFLSSNLIRGIGPVLSSKIVERFGEHTLRVIDRDPEKLLQIPGIGKSKLHLIKESWQKHKRLKNLVIFLRKYGIGPSLALKLFKTYGEKALDVLQKDPYQLMTGIRGVGFVTADGIARSLGVPDDSPLRIKAGILYVLNQLQDEGHACCSGAELLKLCAGKLGISPDRLEAGVLELEKESQVVIEGDGALSEAIIYPAHLHNAESSVVERLTAILCSDADIRRVDYERAVQWAERRLSISFSPGQREALKKALESKVVLITGGPGTGKTMTIRALAEVFGRLGAKLALAAPTGRAAKKLEETSNHAASTIHRLLEYNPHFKRFMRCRENPLELDVLIVDELSMVDVVLFGQLLMAVPDCAKLVLVGDADQLPSIGPGSVLRDLVKSRALEMVELKQIFRQEEASLIVRNAHRIKNGLMPQFGKGRSDFVLISADDPWKISKIVVDLVKEKLPRRFGLNPFHDIQVITPMHKGDIGTRKLNAMLQAVLNPPGDREIADNLQLRVGDKVMQVRNNYDKEVFNGDVGRIVKIEKGGHLVVVKFPGREVTYENEEVGDLTIAYAISVHKSQGSEYPAVVIPLHTTHYPMLQRNLLYTAVTRAKRFVFIVGTHRAIAISVRNDRMNERCSGLAEKLKRAAINKKIIM